MKSEKKSGCNYSSSTSGSEDEDDTSTETTTETTTTTSSDAGAPMLTEAGWCEKCKDNWDSKDCKKKSGCNYSSSTSSSEDDTSTDTTTETTTTTSSDAGAPMLTEAGWCEKCK